MQSTMSLEGNPPYRLEDTFEGRDHPVSSQEGPTREEKLAVEVSDELKSHVDNYDYEKAFKRLDKITKDSTDMYRRLKKLKFDYLVKTVELYSKIDVPSLMVNAAYGQIQIETDLGSKLTGKNVRYLNM